MRVSELVEAMERIAPLGQAEPWDNVGLLVGDASREFKRILLTIDYTSAVAEEGRSSGCDVVVAYHPPIFEGLKRVVAGDLNSVIFEAVRSGVAIYSPHTALDAAMGGTNDVLADAIGLMDRQPLRVADAKSTQYKLVVFVPEAQLSVVSEAIFAAGAGRIGNYSSCSFRSGGTGTFLGEAGSHPRVGEAGRLETTAEIRLETVAPMSRLEAVLAALRKAHPYEEPAFDLNQLAAPPEAGVGQGRIGTFGSGVLLGEVVRRVKAEVQQPSLLVRGEESTVVKKLAICAGAGGELLDDAIRAGADCYLTGELRHHDAIKAARAGMTVICTLHSNSERPALRRLKARLEEELKGVDILISQADCDPFSIK